LTKGLADDRKSGKKKYSWLHPDGKTQVSVVYDGDTPIRVSDVLVSTQHQEGKDRNDIRRYVARQIVLGGIVRRAEVQVAYAIGKARPFSLSVNCFGTGDDREAYRFLKKFDFTPGAIIEKLNLLRPIYRRTTNYGHFGRLDLPWETNPNTLLWS
jgi:S-adenosylmethionine synthetase